VVILLAPAEINKRVAFADWIPAYPADIELPELLLHPANIFNRPNELPGVSKSTC
jgi:hypothetical protein